MTTDAWQTNVAEHDMGSKARGSLHRRIAVVGNGYFVPTPLKQQAHGFGAIDIVIDDQYATRTGIHNIRLSARRCATGPFASGRFASVYCARIHRYGHEDKHRIRSKNHVVPHCHIPLGIVDVLPATLIATATLGVNSTPRLIYR